MRTANAVFHVAPAMQATVLPDLLLSCFVVRPPDPSTHMARPSDMAFDSRPQTWHDCMALDPEKAPDGPLESLDSSTPLFSPAVIIIESE
jgi:hypothetical protein